jgi:pyrimidine-nucleoside phosphorylase
LVSNVVEVISRKRDGGELTAETISWLIDGYARGQVPDYQMAAFAMAVYLQGMTTAETAALTDAMLHSGKILDWPEGPHVVDKHSTGGVGDKVSLVLAPMLAACGLRVPMISGRGLGPTGGTLDKLEAIPGFRTDLSTEEFQRIVNDVGCCISGATAEIAPADKKLYALRDVTATVPSIPLITASIMSKKLAEGLDALVLDVKFGSGAFMKSIDKAQSLAESLEATGRRMGVPTRTILTDMNQPLGRLIGNALEVAESIKALQGEGPEDLMRLTLALGTELLLSTRTAHSRGEARTLLQGTIDSGRAMECFEQMVQAQGGNLAAMQSDASSPQELTVPSKGFIAAIDAEKLGWAVIALGGGRRKLEDPLNHAVGLEILVRVGDEVASAQPWIRVFGGGDEHRTQSAIKILTGAISISETPIPALPLIVESLEG